jgi:hypothetical protein
MAKTALSVLAKGSVGAGGAFVPAPLSAEVIDLLRARSVAFAAGAKTVPMTSQTLKFARVSDPTFEAVTLTAHSWALIVKVRENCWKTRRTWTPSCAIN